MVEIRIQRNTSRLKYIKHFSRTRNSAFEHMNWLKFQEIFEAFKDTFLLLLFTYIYIGETGPEILPSWKEIISPGNQTISK